MPSCQICSTVLTSFTVEEDEKNSLGPWCKRLGPLGTVGRAEYYGSGTSEGFFRPARVKA